MPPACVTVERVDNHSYLRADLFSLALNDNNLETNQPFFPSMCWNRHDYFRKKQKLGILLWERVQQNAPMVPMRTMRATKAPTAMPMITATGNDSAENNQREADGAFYTLQTLQMRDTLTQTCTHIRSGCLQPIPCTGRYSVSISSQAKGLKRKNNTSWIAASKQADKESSHYQCADLCRCFIEFNNSQFSLIYADDRVLWVLLFWTECTITTAVMLRLCEGGNQTHI